MATSCDADRNGIARQSAADDGAKLRLLGESTCQAGSWPRPRRVVMKAEVLPKGPNTRFVVTTRPDPPLAVYDRYVDRGEAENWIKDLKNAVRSFLTDGPGKATYEGR